MRSLTFAVVLSLLCSCPPSTEPDGGSAGGGTSNGGGNASGGGGGSAGGVGGSNGSGGGSGGGAGGGSAPLDPASFCEGRAQRDVSYQLACGYLDPAQRDDALLDARNSCNSRLAFLDAGSVTFSESAASACLARYDGGCTDVTLAPYPECNLARMFLPAGVLGASCGSLNDCVNGACVGTAQTCAACAPYRQTGDLCDFGRACDPASSFCSFIPAPDGGRRCKSALDAGAFCFEFNSCKGGSCLPLVDGGRACGPLPLGSACPAVDNSDFVYCGAANYCRGLRSATSPGTCTPRLSLGATCTDEALDDGCPAGASCLDGVCTRAAYSRTRGQTCDGRGQCVITDSCDVETARGADGGAIRDGHCVARPGLDAGCFRGECAPSLTCIRDVCALPRRALDPCELSFEPCQNSLRCVQVQSDAGFVCLPRRDAGAACEPFQDVCRDTFCPLGSPAPVCEALLPLGARCLVGFSCASGRCVPLVDGGSECASGCI